MKRFGLIGKPLGHSLSPQLHDMLFSSARIDGTYSLYEKEPQEISALPDWAASAGIQGLNVTIPYKQAVMTVCNRLDDSAKHIGAVNTIRVDKEGLTGYNTDYLGVLYMFQMTGISIAGKSVTVLGAGGAAKAFVYALWQAKAACVTVAARNIRSLDAMKEQFPAIRTIRYEGDAGILLPGDLLINTTPVGMFPKTGISPVPASIWSLYSAGADAVYNPVDTQFLTDAKKAGRQTASGLYMLIGQAVAAQKIWLNYKPSDRVVRDMYAALRRQI